MHTSLKKKILFDAHFFIHPINSQHRELRNRNFHKPQNISAKRRAHKRHPFLQPRRRPNNHRRPSFVKMDSFRRLNEKVSRFRRDTIKNGKLEFAPAPLTQSARPESYYRSFCPPLALKRRLDGLGGQGWVWGGWAVAFSK